MKLKRFPQKLLRKGLSQTTPSRREPLAINPPDYSIGYCWFLYHTGRLWCRLPTLLEAFGRVSLAIQTLKAPDSCTNGKGRSSTRAATAAESVTASSRRTAAPISLFGRERSRQRIVSRFRKHLYTRVPMDLHIDLPVA